MDRVIVMENMKSTKHAVIDVASGAIAFWVVPMVMNMLRDKNVLAVRQFNVEDMDNMMKVVLVLSVLGARLVFLAAHHLLMSDPSVDMNVKIVGKLAVLGVVLNQYFKLEAREVAVYLAVVYVACMAVWGLYKCVQ